MRRPRARKCLTSQLGRMAGANSCRTPWQARIDVSASITPPSGWSYSDRLRLTFNLSNANGASGAGAQPREHAVRPVAAEHESQRDAVVRDRVRSRHEPVQVSRQPALRSSRSNFGSARRKFAPTQLYFGLEYVFGGPVLNPISRGLGLREPANERPLTDEQRRRSGGEAQEAIRLRRS